MQHGQTCARSTSCKHKERHCKDKSNFVENGHTLLRMVTRDNVGSDGRAEITAIPEKDILERGLSCDCLEFLTNYTAYLAHIRTFEGYAKGRSVCGILAATASEIRKAHDSAYLICPAASAKNSAHVNIYTKTTDHDTTDLLLIREALLDTLRPDRTVAEAEDLFPRPTPPIDTPASPA